jgi:hypothetical protein
MEDDEVFTYLLMAASLLTVLVMTLFHLPGWLARPLMRVVPVWVQVLAIHFLYAAWIGGVSGHIVGALASLPYYYLARYWLVPRVLGTP